jgi:hypothetical protein
MPEDMRKLPNNWKLENWYGLIRIESEMRGHAEWNTDCANTSYPQEARERMPELEERYASSMRRSSRYLAKAERVAEYRNALYPDGAPAPVEAEPHVNPPLRGDEAVILRQASAIMAERGIHVTARKLWDMAMEIERELKDDDSKQARD